MAFAPAVVKKTPKYLAALPFANPMIGKPINVRIALNARIGARILYLSPIQDVANMTMPAKAKGGAIKHWEAPTPNPISTLRMIGRKYAMA